MATKIPTYNYACEAIGLLYIMKNGYKNNFLESQSFDDQIEQYTVWQLRKVN